MAVSGECRRCGVLIEKPKNPRTTVKKYCSAACRDGWWNESRASGKTWEERCNERYGTIGPLELSEAKAMWLAGVIDGEGTVGVYKQHRPANKSKVRYFANVQVAGTHKGFIEEVARTMGCSSYVSEKANRIQQGHKPVWSVAARRRYVRRTLEAVLPYLIIKKEQAALVLEFVSKVENATCHTHNLTPEFEKFYQQMKVLNKRGV